ncbi:hypothetical protein TNCV_1534161 [Trichonephila clavipes]|nr:hypothetical protein TNCV_1534161 [Trichonephila clavipes]
MRKLGLSGSCIYSAYCGCSELVVGIASMDKLPDLDAFDREQIVGQRRKDHSFSEIVRQLGYTRLKGSRVYQEYIDVDPKLAIVQTAKDN